MVERTVRIVPKWALDVTLAFSVLSHEDIWLTYWSDVPRESEYSRKSEHVRKSG